MSIAEKITRLNTAKNDIATAITNKGVIVAETDGLESFAEKINGIPTGGAPEWTCNKWATYPIIANDKIYDPVLIVLNGEFHLLSGQYHYKLSNQNWISVSNIPSYGGGRCSTILYNNEIHVLYGTSHHKWNGSSWVSVSTLPYDTLYTGVVVYNNEIHIMGGANSNTGIYHYKWNGTSWIKDTNLPYSYEHFNPVVYNNEIHLISGDTRYQYTSHYKWEGTSWTRLSDLPNKAGSGTWFVVNGNKIHALNSYGYMVYDGTWKTYVNNVKMAAFPLLYITIHDGYFISVTYSNGDGLFIQTHEVEVK